MSDIKIERLTKGDVAEVLQFELDNREFLRQTVPGRDDDAFYQPARLQAFLEQQLAEMAGGSKMCYLIRNAKGELAGRCHLYDFKREHLQKAEIGCHLSQRHAGQGIAAKALGLLVQEGFDRYELHRIEASTLTTNLPAQQTVLRCGFRYVGTSEAYVLLNEQWRDCVHFAIINHRWQHRKGEGEA